MVLPVFHVENGPLGSFGQLYVVCCIDPYEPVYISSLSSLRLVGHMYHPVLDT